ncbi:hypothetical protein [Thermus tengchongensis]|uniref:hypothetical protein n=1 Tax=Thermus tengchongensis TaxID=1214928 RepID=UPI0006903FA2|nr:hypothetical protein [Thermus tengchongensis]
MKTKSLLGYALVLGLALAQTGAPLPPPAPRGSAQVQMAQATAHGEKAAWEVAKAQARQAEWQRQRLASPPAWVAQGEALLRQAQADLRAQRFFQAKERAEAAKKVFEAALLLQGQALGKPPKGDVRKAQEKVGRLEAELAYHRQSLPSAQTLLQAAKGLLTSQPSPFQLEAARKLADAGRHALKAERGF